MPGNGKEPNEAILLELTLVAPQKWAEHCGAIEVLSRGISADFNPWRDCSCTPLGREKAPLKDHSKRGYSLRRSGWGQR